MILDYQELVEAIERASKESAPKRPDSQIIENPNWYQIITPSVSHPHYNGVIYSVLREGEAEYKIRQIQAQYLKLQLPFRWELSPTCNPKNLGNLLKSAGFTRSSNVLGLGADPKRLVIKPKSDVQVEIVNEETAPEWIATSEAGWIDSPEPSRNIHFLEDVLTDLKAEPRKVFYFLARSEGKAVGAASLRQIQRTGYLQGTSVLPEFRKRGVYTTLVGYRLEFIMRLGIPIATVQCLKETSAPILQRFGFETVCEITIYHFEK